MKYAILFLFLLMMSKISCAQLPPIGIDLSTGSFVGQPSIGFSTWTGVRYNINQYIQTGIYTGFHQYTGITFMNIHGLNTFDAGVYINGEFLKSPLTPVYTIRGGMQFGSIGQYASKGFGSTVELGVKLRLGDIFSVALCTAYGIVSTKVDGAASSTSADIVHPVIPVYLRISYH
jgi:hypothetical protein